VHRRFLWAPFSDRSGLNQGEIDALFLNAGKLSLHVVADKPHEVIQQTLLSLIPANQIVSDAPRELFVFGVEN
jgi:hypothetical protein